MRRTTGNSSISNSCLLPSSSGAKRLTPVTLPPGWTSDRANPSATMSSATPTIGVAGRHGLDGADWRAAAPDHESLDFGLDQLARDIRKPRVRNPNSASVSDQVAGLDQAIAAQLVEQHADRWRSARIGVENTDAIDLGVLRACRERPRRGAAEQCDELAAIQLIEMHTIQTNQSP